MAQVRDHLRLLQTLAAIAGLSAAVYTMFLRDYFFAPPPALATGYTSLPCKELIAVDGDTVRCDGAAMREMGDGSPFKIGIDAPEVTRPRCDNEYHAGQLAKERMSELLEGINHVEDSGARDPSDRRLVKVRLADGRTAGAVLVSEGLAAVWSPGYKPHWCDDAQAK